MAAVALVGTSPAWFRGFDIILELFSFIVAFAIAYISIRVYKMTERKRFLAFSAAFTLLGLSFLARMVSELLVYLEVLRDVSIAVAAGPTNLESAVIFGRFIYIAVVFVAYWVLAAIVLRIDDKRTLTLVSLLLAVLAWLAHFELSGILFHIINLIFLVFVASHYLGNYLKQSRAATLLTALAFLALVAENVLFMLALLIPPLYIAGYLFRLIGFFLFFITLVRVARA